MSTIAPIEAELKQVQEEIRLQTERRQTILHEIEKQVQADMKTKGKKLTLTLPIGIVVALALWGVALWMNLSQNTGRALETYPCAVPISLVILGIVAIVVAIWLGIPKESQIRKEANEARGAELEEVKQALGPLQIKERQLKQEIERQRYTTR